MSTKSHNTDEKKVINALLKYQKEDFILDEETGKENGEYFYSFNYKYDGRDGWITFSYNPISKKIPLNSNNVVAITMDCKFQKTISPNNYESLDTLAIHILNLFGKK